MAILTICAFRVLIRVQYSKCAYCQYFKYIRFKAAESVSLSNYCMWIFLCHKKLHMTKLSIAVTSCHKTSLSVSFGWWHLSGIPLFLLHFTVNTIAWQRKFEQQWVLMKFMSANANKLVYQSNTSLSVNPYFVTLKNIRAQTPVFTGCTSA